jgi:hypothetical protein
MARPIPRTVTRERTIGKSNDNDRFTSSSWLFHYSAGRRRHHLRTFIASRQITPSSAAKKPGFEAVLPPFPRGQQLDPAACAGSDRFGDSQSETGAIRLRLSPFKRL